ncbi:MAG: tetratricopeptide repeat protein [Candidatus Poribacteria bacterium]|nr:tetratricopeptide repeat protein [Candidatus Poribacteria bacterium]
MKKITTLLIIIQLTILTITTATFAQEEWEKEMQKDFAKVLKAQKDAPEKHRELIAEWQKEGHLAELIQRYETEKVNRENDAAFIYGLGYAYALTDTKQNADAEEIAISHYETALQLDPSLFWAHYSLGAIYQKQQNYDQALTKFQTCLTINPEYYPAHYYIGEIHLKQGKHAEALQSFEVAQTLNPKWEYPIYGRGLVYFDQGNLNQARETFERAIQNNRKFAPAYIKLGQVLAKEKFFDDALQEYQKAAEYQPYTATDVFDLAVIFAEADNTDGAVQLYHRTLEIDATYAPAHFAVADVLYLQGDITTAIIHYKRAIASDPALKDKIYKPLEPYFAETMGADDARELLKKAMSILPNDPRSQFYMGKLEADAGNTEKAIAHYKKTLEIVDADPSYLELQLPRGHFHDSYVHLGDLYRQQGNLETAATYYRQALELNPDLATRFWEQGKTAFESGNYKDAVEPLNVHIILFPKDIDATYLLGQTYEANEDKANALVYYEKTLQLDANRSDVLYKMVQIYREGESHQQAIDALEKIIVINPEDAQAHYLSALSHVELEQPDEALAAFLETVRLTPDNVAAQYQIGMLYENKGDIDNAIVYFEKTTELDPENAEPFFRLGGIYQERKDEDNMIRVYQPALKLEPNHPNIHHTLAVIFERRSKEGAEENHENNIQQAFHHYALANEHDPEHFDWHYSYARLLDTYAETLENFHKHAEMAVKEYTATIALKPDLVDAYFHRGMITNRYKRIGNTLYRSSQILEDFKQVVDLEPKNVDAHYHIGTLQLYIEQHKLAEETFQKVIQLEPKYKGVHTHLGKLAEREQNWKKAIQLYEKEIAIDDEATEAYQRLGDLYYNSEMELNKAKDMLIKALALNDAHVPTIIVYANVLYSMDQLGAAADQFEHALQLEPRNLTANYNLALMYQYTERTELAKEQWKQFLKLNPPEQWKVEAENHLSKLGGK